MPRPLSLMTLVFVLLAASPAVAQKVDLSLILGNIPSIGDTRTYTINTGGQQVLEVTQVQFVGKAFRIVARSEETGLPVSFLETFIVPGKQRLLGSSESAPLSIIVTKPKRLERFVFKVGKLQRAVVKGVAFSGANLVGPAIWLAESEFQGFEAFDTGIDFFPETVRIRRALGLGVTNAFTGDQVVAASSQTSWSTPDLGAVAIQRRIVTYLNGFQQSDTGIQNLTLTSAVINGVSYP